MSETIRKNSRRALLRRRRIIVLSVLALLVIALVFGGIKLFRSCRASGARRSLPFGAQSEFCYTGGGFLYTADKTLKYLDLSDEAKSYSVHLERDGASVAGSERVKAVYSASSLQIVGTPYEHSFEGAIRKVVCGGKYVGAYIENADNTHSLLVFNSAGDRCYKNDLGTSALLDFGFEGGDSAAMYLSELVTTGSAVSTTVTTLDLARESITGVMNIPGEIAKKVLITQKSVFVFGTDSLIRYDRATNSEAYRMLIRGYECKDTCASDGRLYLLLSRDEEAGVPDRVLSVKESDAPDDSVLELSFASNALGCFLMRGKVVAVSESKAEIRSMKGEITASIPLGIKADSVQKLGDGRLLLTEGDSASLFTLKNF